MLKKIVAAVSVVLICVFLVVPEMDVDASNLEFRVSYAEPSKADTQGYLHLLLLNNSSGTYYLETYFWYCCAVNDSGGISPCYMDVSINSAVVTMRPGGSKGASTAYYNLMSVGPTGSYGKLASSSSTPFSINLGASGWTILNYKIAGNVGNLSDNGVAKNVPFDVYYNTDGSAVLLEGILSALLSVQGIDSSILATVQNILNSVDGVENQLSSVISYLQSVDSRLSSISSQLSNIYSKANEILSEEKEQNTWLEKIFNWLEDSPEQEKEAASNQANQSSNDAQSSIEDKSAGFVDSVNGLASSMSYSGTQCAWTFPSLYLPEIPGVMSRTQLTSEKPIDFSYWVNQIPSDILLLVRSVLTIALIVYCFKEFYSVIEYVLTMRGGGNSE